MEVNINLCQCNMCNGIFEDTNPQIGAKIYTVHVGKYQELINHACPVCLTGDYLTDEIKTSETI